MKNDSAKNSKGALKDSDFLYDRKGFLEWTVNNQCKSSGTAASYLSLIENVFTTQFDLKVDNPFDNIRRAYLNTRSGSPEAFDTLEIEFESLKGYKEMIEYYGMISDDGEYAELSSDTTLAAMRMYLKYIRWKIDRRRLASGLQIHIADDKEMFINLPFSKEFRQYLKNKGRGYTTSSIDSIACKLRRVYNLLLRRKLKRDFMSDLKVYINQGHDLGPILERIDAYIDYEEGSSIAIELTKDDFARGKAAFALYREFIEDYTRNREKYN